MAWACSIAMMAWPNFFAKRSLLSVVKHFFGLFLIVLTCSFLQTHPSFESFYICKGPTEYYGYVNHVEICQVFWVCTGLSLISIQEMFQESKR